MTQKPEQTWTKEPWSTLQTSRHEISIHDAHGAMVVETPHRFNDGPEGGNVTPTDAANASRIVACVNALAGVSDPQYFMQVVLGNVEPLPDVEDIVAVMKAVARSEVK